MSLSPEQVQQYRQKYGFDTPQGASSAPAPAQNAQDRINRLKAIAEAPEPSGTTAVSSGGMTQVPAAPPEPKKNIFGKVVSAVGGFAKDVAADAAKTLLVKPAARVAEAVGRTGVLGEKIQTGYEVMNDEGGQSIPTPFGPIKVEAVKSGGEGIKQIGGEALKSASYLYGGQGVGTAGKSLFGGKAGSAIVQGAKAGAVSGGAYGAGEALEQGKGAGDVAKEGLIGATIGAVAGGVVPAVPAIVKGTVGAGKAVIGGSKRVVGALDDAGARSAELATRAPAVRKAIESGIDDNIVNFIETAAPEDQSAFRKMFDLAEKGAKDLRFRTQAKQVAGSTLLDRANHLIKVKDIAVGNTNRVLNSLDQTPVDTSNILYTFLKDMQEKGITVVKRGNGYQFATQGAVPEGDLSAYRTMLNILKPDADGSVMRSYRGLHTGRQRIFNELNLAKARQQTFSDDVTRYADKFRTMLLEPIDKASGGKYKAAQQKTAETLGALRDFVQLMGYKGDLEKITAKDLKAGEIASRILGNAADRPMSAIQALDDVAMKYGYKGKGSVLDQVQFADLLEDVFGTTQSRGMRGQVGRGALDAVSEVTGAVNDTATGNVLALGSRALKAVIGKSKDDQIKALKELLGALGTPRTNFGR